MATTTTPRAPGARPYASVNLTPAALDRLRRTTYTVQAAAGRRVPTSDVVTALTVLAQRHAEELTQIIAARPTRRKEPTPDDHRDSPRTGR